MASNKPLSLVIGSDLYEPSIGGTETVTKNMATHFASIGWDVTVVAPGERKKTPYIQNDPAGFRVLRVKSFPVLLQKNVRFGLRSRGEIEDYLKDKQVDIFHVNNPAPISKALIKTAHQRGKKVVVGAHLMPETFLFGLRKLTGLFNFVDTRGWRAIVKAYNRADFVISPTKTAINYLKQNGLKVPSEAISNGIDLKKYNLPDISKQELRRDLGIKTQYNLIYMGRISVEKNIDQIINSLPILRKHYDVSLTLIGDGNAASNLKKIAAKNGVADICNFVGYVNDADDKLRWLMAADIFVIASTVELQSITTLEAMTAKLPVVAVDAGALPELAHPGYNGELFSAGDYKDLAEKIAQIISSPKLLQKYSKNSFELVKKHDIKITWLRYEEVYRSLVTK